MSVPTVRVPAEETVKKNTFFMFSPDNSVLPVMFIVEENIGVADAATVFRYGSKSENSLPAKNSDDCYLIIRRNFYTVVYVN